MSQEETSKEPRLFFNWIVPIVAVLFVAGLLIVFNGGIRVGFSNHTGLLPVVRHLLDDNYLPHNFGISLRLFHHRSFAYLVATFSLLFGEDNALISLSVIGFILLSASLYVLCRSLKLSLFAYLASGFFLAMSIGWTGLGLETNTFVGNREVQPPTYAHAFLLFATACLIGNRLRFAAFFAGMVVLFHLQIGFAFTLILLPFFAIRLKAIGVREALLLIGLFLLPAVLPLIDVAQMLNRGLVTNPFTLADIYFRQPAHFELRDLQSTLWFLVHVGLQLAVYFWLRRSDREASARMSVLLLMSLMISGLSALHLLDYYFLKNGTLVKFQFLRMSMVVTVFGMLSFLLWLQGLVKEKLPGRDFVLNIGLIVIAVGLYFIPATRQGANYSFEISRFARQSSEWVKVCLWIKENTAREAIFLTPPGTEGFTYLSNRANVAEFKINPDGGQYLYEWYDRLRDLAGGELPSEKGFTNAQALNRAYAALNKPQLFSLKDKYKADYALLPKSSAVELESVFENNSYKVVRLTP